MFFALFIFDAIINGLNDKIIITSMILLIVYVFILYVFYNIAFTIDKQLLYIKIGFFSYKPICIEDIKKVSKLVNYYSSPAASFDRI